MKRASAMLLVALCLALAACGKKQKGLGPVP